MEVELDLNIESLVATYFASRKADAERIVEALE